MPTVDQLFEEAMHLDPGERQLLAHRLMDAVAPSEGEPDEDWEEAWLEGIRRRLDAHEAGEPSFSGEEVETELFGAPLD